MLDAEGITCDRRTLSEDIGTLNANGFEVLHRRTRDAKLPPRCNCQVYVIYFELNYDDS